MSFITKNNFLTLYLDNFSPSITLENIENSYQEDLNMIRDGKIEKFQVIEEVKKHMLFENHVHNFINIIENS